MVDEDPASCTVRKEFADAFRRARLDAGLTQLQVAVQAGVTPNHLSAIERGRHDTKLSTAARLAESVGKVLQIRLVDPPAPSRKRKV